MSSQYITAEEQLPETEGVETVLQVRDAETKEIFHTRARVAKEPSRLDRPEPLSVVKGPHEDTAERWFIEFVDESGSVEERLERLVAEQETRSNVVNTRSDDLNVLLRYLVETGHYGSTADAARELCFEQLADDHPSLLETYAELKREQESDPLREALEEDRDADVGYGVE